MTWLDLVGSFFGGGCACMCVFCVCVRVCVCARSVLGDLRISPTAVPPEDMTALLTTAHSANLTDSLVQLSAKKQPTRKVQVPAEESSLP